MSFIRADGGDSWAIVEGEAAGSSGSFARSIRPVWQARRRAGVG
jgi:hypothetical protein